MISLWDYCQIDPSIVETFNEIQEEINGSPVEEKKESEKERERVGPPSSSGATSALPRLSPDVQIESLLCASHESCEEAQELLDDVLRLVQEIKSAYFDVTGRTNSLIQKCENLLEEQHTLQHTVEVLKKTLRPFDEIEEVAAQLGIPLDTLSHTHSAHNAHAQQADLSLSPLSLSLDPRSPEFQEILRKLSRSLSFLRRHRETLSHAESERYTQWLERLRVRATSLIGRAMRDLVDRAATQCREALRQRSSSHKHKPTHTQSQSHALALTYTLAEDDAPLESSFIYQKFRALAFRMRELSAVLARSGDTDAHVEGEREEGEGDAEREGESEENDGHHSPHHNTQHTRRSRHTHPRSHAQRGSYGGEERERRRERERERERDREHAQAVLGEVKKAYLSVRIELLLPLVRENWQNSVAGRQLSLSSPSQPHTATPSPTHAKGTLALSHSHSGEALSSQAITLSSGLRQAFSTLLRVVQLECQLFESLFLTAERETNTLSHSLSHSHSHKEISRSASQDSHAHTPSHHSHSSHNVQEALSSSQELQRIVESLSNTTRDLLRPLIIREKSVDELCRVISSLCEDMRAQILVLPIPPSLSRSLLSGLDSSVNDAKERLAYCAETQLRQEVQFFEPLPSQLSYPDILESFAEKKKSARQQKTIKSVQQHGRPSPGGNNALSSAFMREAEDVEEEEEEDLSLTSSNTNNNNNSALSLEVYHTWFPPMRATLSLLSKLYGVVEMTVFEDFARRALSLCVSSLVHAAERVRRTRTAIHGDLFLVRHLLTLREQLIPFEISLQCVEREMDFSSTSLAWKQMLRAGQTDTSGSASSALVTATAAQRAPSAFSFGGVNSLAYLSSLVRLDEQNLLLQFARQGLPGMHEHRVDAKQDLDLALKKACLAFKQSALKMLLGPLDSLLAKAAAFGGEQLAKLSSSAAENASLALTYDGSGSTHRGGNHHSNNSDARALALPAETKTLLRAQAFLRPERIRECLEQVQQLLVQRLPDVKHMLKLYVDNQAARSVLSKSVLQEFEQYKLKLECVLANCVDAGQALRELEQQVSAIDRSITAELSTR